MTVLKDHDIVALVKSVKTKSMLTDKEIELQRGQIGTIVDSYDGKYLVDFSDRSGATFAMESFREADLFLLHDKIVPSKSKATAARLAQSKRTKKVSS